ncbi:MAG: DUF4445 domain-containing protein [Chloroflexi bacterium]|nr:DUF4445 domain-containing protein [Chloroflexota bacterium]
MTDTERYTVIFQPSGSRGKVAAGTTVMEAARQFGVGIESTCGGRGICSKCRVEVGEGYFERFGLHSSMQNLSSTPEGEAAFFASKGLDPAVSRRSCLAQVQGSLVVFVPEESRTNRQIVRKGARELNIPIKPAVRHYYVEIAPPTLDDPLADWERLQNALSVQHGLPALSIDYHTLRELPHTLRTDRWRVTVAVWHQREVIKVTPGFVENTFGLAIDIGTTTIAAYLSDLETGTVVATESLMNPQVAYGDDVMARITHTLTHDDGLSVLHHLLVDGLNTVIARIADKANVAPQDILEVVLVGNTCMHHLLLNLDPRHVGLSPFTPVLHHSLDIKARELGFALHPATNVHFLPVIAGFVGADTVACVLAEQMHHQDEILLLMDIGTNGEMVLGNRERLVAASCATGPAFEGAQITFGMRAAEGAIEKINIDPLTWDVRYKVIGEDTWNDQLTGDYVQPRGICGSAIIDLGWELFKAGIVNAAGRFNANTTSPRLRRTNDGYAFVLVWADDTAIGRDITFNTHDMRALQLAKAAMYCAAKIMMRHLDVSDLKRVVLAGAFGSYIDKTRAMAGGLFPDCDLKTTYAVGNAAGDGARMCLLNVDLRAKADHLARSIDYIELTAEPDFDRLFADAIGIPHAEDSFPHLEPLFEKARRQRYERFVRSLPAFAPVPDRVLRQVVAAMREQFYRRRTSLFTADSSPDALYLLVDGQVNLVNNEQVQAEFQPGSWLSGRQLDEQQTAIVASRLAHVFVIPAEALAEVIAAVPELAQALER